MISIIVNGYNLELGDVSLSVNLKSPVFFGEMVFEGSYIFDFQVPASVKNCDIFNHYNMVGVRNRPVLFETLVFVDGIELFEGEIKVVRSSDKFFDLRFYMLNGYFNQKIKDRLISNIDLGTKESVLPAVSKIFANFHFNETYPAPPAPAVTEYYHPEFYRFNHNGVYGYFHELDNVYTVTQHGFLRFSGALNIEVLYGTVYLVVYKNNVAVLEVEFDSPVKQFVYEGVFNGGDTFVFAIKSVSEGFPMFHRTEYFLKGNSHIMCEDWPADKKMILEPGHDDVCFFPIRNDDAYEGLSNETLKSNYKQVLPVINYFEPDSTDHHRFNPFFCSTNQIIGNVFVPTVFFKHILNCICAELGLVIEFDSSLKAELETLVISNNYSMNNADAYSVPGLSEGDTVMVPYLIINPLMREIRDYVPKIKVSEFIKLYYLFGLVLFPNGSKRLVFKGINDILDNPDYLMLTNVIADPEIEHEVYDGYQFEFKPAGDGITDDIKVIDSSRLIGMVNDVEDLPEEDIEIGDICFVAALQQYWIYEYNETSEVLEWIFFSLNVSFEKSAEGENEISVDYDFFPIVDKVSPKFDIVESGGMPYLWLIPKSLFPLRFKNRYETRDVEAPNWFAFYRGLQNTTDGRVYPMGSSGFMNVQNVQIPGCEIELKWDGETGLFKQFWEKWAAFLMESEPVTLKRLITVDEVIGLDFSKKVMYDNQVYLIREISFSITNRGFSEAEYILMPVN